MLSAIWRKMRADIKSNKLQLGLIFAVLALSAMLLTISLLMMGSADEPWERTFEETNGPHIWAVSNRADIDFSPLLADPEVTETTGAFLALANNPIMLGDDKISIFLYEMDTPPPVAHPLLAAGRWLDPATPDEIVMDFSMANFYDFKVGDSVDILSAQGTHPLKIVGLAVTAHWFPYDEITKNESPGVGYISSHTLYAIQPDPTYHFAVIGLRLLHPENSKDFTEKFFQLFPTQMQSVIEWQWVKQNATLANTLNVMFIGLFSMIGLIAVGMIIFNTIGGQVLSQYREIGFLKALGFTPGQITALFLGEHLVIGFLAAVIGITLGVLAAPGMISPLAENLNVPPPDLLAPAPLVAVLLLIEIAVALATWLPAWQGGRIDTMQAITVGYQKRERRTSTSARLAALLRLPVVVVLGVKDNFSRPLRAALAISALALTILIAMTALSAQATATDLSRNRFYFNGTTADLKVDRNFVPQEYIQQGILASPEVTDYYTELPLYGQAPGHQDQPLLIRLLDGNYQNFDFKLKEGRMPAAPGEAVMGYAVLEMLQAKIGDTVDLFANGHPIKLTIVGRSLEDFNLNYVVMTSLETYHQQADSSAAPQVYDLRLKDPSQAEDLRKNWLAQYQELITISVVTQEPQSSMTQLVDIIKALGLIMLLVAGANMMSASLLSIRERTRDFGIQKTLGLTPMQIGASVVVGSIWTAVIAMIISLPLTVWIMASFISQLGISIGAGPDFYRIDWVNYLYLLPGFVALAILSSLLPAIRAARLEVIEALRYE